ncbi:hypothetical protein [Sporosarcina sp. HYO08]|uniref:hypothetical protein n=1 Tax=Sporosarcina sp. HYO08 TaxID=1759557 RepID=UPI000799D492|nr:hypothetical protein [Sporosarcina sp. HYO08]KXH78365.1 hypothetical protein AU377_13305 [Sporosarcina sp. HYO08]
MNLKKGTMVLTLAGLLLFGGLAAEAGTSWSGTQHSWVPGTNGSASTSSQTKARTNASSDLIVSAISVNNKLDTRALGGGSNGVVSGPWVRDTNVGSYAIPNPTGAGWSTQLITAT